MRTAGNPSRSIALLLTALALSAWAPADTPISDAVRRGDADAVRVLLRDGADVNASAGDGMTALHWAADAGEVEIAKILIDAGANVHALTRLGDYTPLHLASRQGSALLIEALLAGGASPESNSTAGGSSALHFAAGAGSVEAIRMLLEHGAEVNGREASRGQTPLMFAAAKGRADAIRALLANGADAALTSLVVSLPERLAEDRAAGQRRREVLAEFRAEAAPGVDEAWRPTPVQVEAAVRAATQAPEAGGVRTAAGEDRLAEAYRRGFAPEPEEDTTQQTTVIEEVTSLSFVELVGTIGGTTALIYAVREGHVTAALALLDGGADVNQMNTGDHTSALASATINGHFDLALKLLERGADPNLVNDGGVGPLFATLNVEWAPKSRYPQQQAYRQQEATYRDLMSALLEAGADPNQRLTRHVWFMEYTFTHLGINMTGATPFWRAAHALDIEAMKILVASGADTNVPTVNVPRGRRGFGRGGRGGGGGADPSGLDPVPAGGPGVFPIHAASGHGYGIGYAGNSHRHVPDAWLPALRYLVEELGADVNTRDANAHTPLHNAAARGDTEMIQYLVDQRADVMAVNRRGLTTVDMANGPSQRTQPYPEAIELLESLGAKNNHRCTSCQ